jgi:hypothetical protein
VGIPAVYLLLLPTLRKHDARQSYLAELRDLPRYAADFNSPAGAILCLEQAYLQRDIEGVVACKDFVTEARLMLSDIGRADIAEPNIIAETARVLELGFRKEVQEQWPDFDGLESYFTKQEAYADGVVAVTEVCRWPDGGYCEQKILVSETPNGWRVLYPLDE